MAIKRVTYDTLKFLVAEIKERYAEKGDIGALGGLDKVAVENLTEDLKSLINGKADAATTLAGYGIKDGMTATEVAAAISTAIAGTDHLSRVMVDSTGDIDTVADDAEKKIYMVKNASGEAGNLYSEYMVINGKLESRLKQLCKDYGSNGSHCKCTENIRKDRRRNKSNQRGSSGTYPTGRLKRNSYGRRQCDYRACV